MGRDKSRRLSAEERDLWKRVTETATPLRPKTSTKAIVPVEKPKPARNAPVPVPPFMIGAKASGPKTKADTAGSIEAQVARAPVKMDHKKFAQLKKGKLKIDARLDLHGMTLADAHPALISFILSSHAAGHRLVLVITGKGKGTDDRGPIPIRRGILRHQVPHWLGMAPLSPVVLQVVQAHHKHGGTGAYYVYLKRRR